MRAGQCNYAWHTCRAPRLRCGDTSLSLSLCAAPSLIWSVCLIHRESGQNVNTLKNVIAASHVNGQTGGPPNDLRPGEVTTL